MKRILAGCLALVAAAAVSSIPPAPGFAATCQRAVTIQPEVSTGEGTGTLSFAVRSRGCAAAGSVAYLIEAGTAQAGTDFTLPAGRLEWRAGDTDSRSITAKITSDLAREADLETFSIRLADPSPGIRLATTTGTGRILDDDGPSSFAWVVDDGICDSIVPGCSCHDVDQDLIDCGSGLHVSALTSAPPTVRFSTVDGTARAGVDFVGITDRVVTVPAGTTSVELPVELLPRPVGTPERSFGIRIFAPSAGRIIDAVAVITIHGT